MKALPPPTERSIQRAILAMAGTCFRDVFITAIPNGAHLAGNDVARFKQMGALKGDGLKIGMPDLLCLWKMGQGCFIEVKRPKIGKLSDEQAKVHARLIDLLWPVTTVTSVEEAYTFLRQCGAPCSAAIAGEARSGETHGGSTGTASTRAERHRPESPSHQHGVVG